MLITKRESKDLRYFARANYKSAVKGVDTENGKIKHREFPCFGLSYDEAKADKGMVELTNVTIEGKPFEGDYDDLMACLWKILDNPDALCDAELEQDKTLMEQHCEPCLLHGPDCTQEPLPPGPPIVQRLKESETGKNLETMAAAVAELSHPEIKVVQSEIKDLSEDGTLTVDVQAVIQQAEDSVNVAVKVVGDHVETTTAVEIPAEPAPEADSVPDEPVDAAALLNTPIKVYTDTHAPADSDVHIYPKPVEEPKKKIIVVTGPVCPERHDSRRDFSIEILEEAKKVVEETGKPVITAVQKLQKSRWEFFDLRIKCATMALAKSYGEPPELDIGTIMSRYPDAMDKLNALYTKDGIQPYTISEDAIKNAYPDEYAALCS